MIEIGMRDMEKGVVTVVRRDNMEKSQVKPEALRETIQSMAEKMKKNAKGGMNCWHQGYANLFLAEYVLATGDKKDVRELDLVAERIFNLHRALTIRDMGTFEMRARHDTVPDWVFDDPPDKPPFAPGTFG
jgi:hypothetical protein